MSIYHDEHGMEHPASAFTQFAGGILDSYYIRISQSEKELEQLRDQKQSLEYDNTNLVEDRKKWIGVAETRKDMAERFTRKADQLQNHLDEKATEIVKRDKAIEQYAAWRVAVREAINDVPKERLKSGDPLTSVIVRIADLTKAMEEETKSD